VCRQALRQAKVIAFSLVFCVRLRIRCSDTNALWERYWRLDDVLWIMDKGKSLTPQLNALDSATASEWPIGIVALADVEQGAGCRRWRPVLVEEAELAAGERQHDTVRGTFSTNSV